MSTSSKARDIAASAIRAAESDVTRRHAAVMRGAFAGEARQARATVRRRADSPLAETTYAGCPLCSSEMRTTQYGEIRLTVRRCVECRFEVRSSWRSVREKG